jgi:hypothetical protein
VLWAAILAGVEKERIMRKSPELAIWGYLRQKGHEFLDCSF